MKILIITHYFSPHIGGIENVVLNQANVTAQAGHTVTVLTSKLANDKDLEYHGNVRVVRVPAYNFLEKKFGIPYPLFSPKLINIVKQEVSTHDIVHAHGHVYLGSVLGSIYARIYKKPFILTQHNIFIEYKSLFFRCLQTFADITLGKFVLSGATKIITVSEESKKYILSILKQKKEIIVSYNGVDIDRFKPAADKSALKKTFNIDGKFVCLTVRRITFKNGVDTILQAAMELKDNSDVLFLIAGRGPDSSKVEQFIADHKLHNVRLLGFVSEDALVEYYSAADVFILPSKSGEGFPLAVLEAFASGIPVIATRSGGHVEVIEKDTTGYIVEPNDYKTIAKKISDIYADRDLLKKMSEYTRKLAVEKFSWSKNVSELLSIYKSV